MQDLIEEIKRQRKFAADTLEDATPQTIKARKDRKRNAALRLQDLFFDYRQQIRPKVFIIAAIGDGIDEFEKLSTDIAGLQGLESDAFYHHLVSKIDDRLLDGRTQNSYIIDVVSRILEEVVSDLGVVSYNQIFFNQKYDGKISSREDVLKLVKRVIDEQVGEEMASLFIIDKAVRYAFEHELEAKVHPFLVKVRNEKNLQSLLSGLKTLGNKSIVVSVGKSPVEGELKVGEVNEKTVLDALKKIKKKIK